MTIYTFTPALLRASSMNFQLVAVSASSPQSAFNPLTFVDGPTVEVWRVDMTIVPQREADWRDMAALLRALRGRRNKVRLFDPSRRLRGVGPGPTINATAAVAAGATSISVDGLTASQAAALAADDLFGIGENLYAVTSDAPSDSGGAATISFLPPLRVGIADNDPITLPSADLESVDGPTGLFMLLSGGDGMTISPGRISAPLNLQFIESPDFE